MNECGRTGSAAYRTATTQKPFSFRTSTISTFGIDADSIKAAKPRLERIETDILNNFKRLGVAARTLDGKERLSQLHAVFHMDEQLPFQFEWDWLAPSGLSTKDFIAPSSFEFRTGKQFRMGKKYGAVSFLQKGSPRRIRHGHHSL